MRNIVLAAAAVTATLGSSAVALPVLIDYSSINAHTHEDFEGRPAGELSSSNKGLVQRAGLIFLPPPEPDAGPFRFRGFSFVPEPTFVTAISDEKPCTLTDQCLATWSSPTIDFPAGGAPAPGGTFGEFLPSTIGLGIKLPGTPSIVSIVANGASGTASYELHSVTSFGILDLAGLSSVELRGAQFFDDVTTTSTAAPVPLSPTWMLGVLAFGSLALLRRRA